jgi:hypothetical protein
LTISHLRKLPLGTAIAASMGIGFAIAPEPERDREPDRDRELERRVETGILGIDHVRKQFKVPLNSGWGGLWTFDYVSVHASHAHERRIARSAVFVFLVRRYLDVVVDPAKAGTHNH